MNYQSPFFLEKDRENHMVQFLLLISFFGLENFFTFSNFSCLLHAMVGLDFL